MVKVAIIVVCILGVGTILYFVHKNNHIPVVDMTKSALIPEEIERFNDEMNHRLYNFSNYPDVPLSDEDEQLTAELESKQLEEQVIASIVKEIDKEYEEYLDYRANARFSINVGGGYIADEDLEPKGLTFHTTLLKLISDKNMTNVEFYKAAWIDRKLFSAIKNDLFYKPKKETAVACCFGLRLDKKEADMLLESAGYTLSNSIQWDRIIDYCICHEIYDINQVNQVLYAKGEKCIGC